MTDDRLEESARDAFSDEDGRSEGVYDALGVTPILNVAGANTKYGGPTINEAAARAMDAATRQTVRMDELQASASRIIAEITGAEAGYVTSGAAAGLTVATAAAMCGLDIAKMNRLPDVRDMRSEVIISRSHRSGYDHAFRAAGARLIEVGMDEVAAGAGVRRTEPWEYVAAVSERTAAVAYVCNALNSPPLEAIIDVCREADLPLIVDAAAQVPPVANLKRLPGSGADVVVFSGGKGIRGPQGAGIVAGSRDLIMSMALQNLDLDDHWELWDPPTTLIDKSRLQGLPRHGLGRGFKVTKEEIVGVLVALRSVSAGEDEARLQACHGFLSQIAESLSDMQGVSGSITEVPSSYPTLDVQVDHRSPVSAIEATRALRACETPIYLGEKRLMEGVLTINPISLTQPNTDYLISQLRRVLAG
jgi:D-glucosaminate-6-phosphate ammonia-lyase